MPYNSVNTNVGAMVALQNLNATNSDLAMAQNRINTGKKVANAKELDAKILSAVPKRDQKVQAPEPFKPSGKFKDGKAAVLAFQATRDRNLETIRTTKEPMRLHFSKSSVFGELDALQWYLFMSAHTERHVNQMVEVKASQGFPKK